MKIRKKTSGANSRPTPTPKIRVRKPLKSKSKRKVKTKAKAKSPDSKPVETLEQRLARDPGQFVVPYLKEFRLLERAARNREGAEDSLRGMIADKFRELFDREPPEDRALILIHTANAYELQRRGYELPGNEGSMPEQVARNINAALAFEPERLSKYLKDATFQIMQGDSVMAKTLRKKKTTTKVRGRKSPKSSATRATKSEVPMKLDLLKGLITSTENIRNGRGKTSGLPLEYYLVYLLGRKARSKSLSSSDVSSALLKEFPDASARWKESSVIHDHVAMFNRGALSSQRKGVVKTPGTPVTLTDASERAASKGATRKKKTSKKASSKKKVRVRRKAS